MRAGVIAETLGIPNSSLSFHLPKLSRAGLVRPKKHHRSIIHRANKKTINALVGHLLETCCDGLACRPEATCASASALLGSRGRRPPL